MSTNPAAAVKTIKRGQGSFQYLGVADRVRWFREEHADGIIDVDLVQWDPAAGVAVVKANVTIPSTGGTATGLGSACRSDLEAKVVKKSVQPDQVESYVEFAETAAVGRALGKLGYGTDEALDEAGPVDTPRQVQEGREEPDPLIVARNMVRETAKACDMTGEDLQRYILEWQPGRTWGSLSVKELVKLDLILTTELLPRAQAKRSA